MLSQCYRNFQLPNAVLCLKMTPFHLYLSQNRLREHLLPSKGLLSMPNPKSATRTFLSWALQTLRILRLCTHYYWRISSVFLLWLSRDSWPVAPQAVHVDVKPPPGKAVNSTNAIIRVRVQSIASQNESESITALYRRSFWFLKTVRTGMLAQRSDLEWRQTLGLFNRLHKQHWHILTQSNINKNEQTNGIFLEKNGIKGWHWISLAPETNCHRVRLRTAGMGRNATHIASLQKVKGCVCCCDAAVLFHAAAVHSRHCFASRERCHLFGPRTVAH